MPISTTREKRSGSRAHHDNATRPPRLYPMRMPSKVRPSAASRESMAANQSPGSSGRWWPDDRPCAARCTIRQFVWASSRGWTATMSSMGRLKPCKAMLVLRPSPSPLSKVNSRVIPWCSNVLLCIPGGSPVGMESGGRLMVRSSAMESVANRESLWKTRFGGVEGPG